MVVGKSGRGLAPQPSIILAGGSARHLRQLKRAWRPSACRANPVSNLQLAQSGLNVPAHQDQLQGPLANGDVVHKDVKSRGLVDDFLPLPRAAAAVPAPNDVNESVPVLPVPNCQYEILLLHCADSRAEE